MTFRMIFSAGLLAVFTGCALTNGGRLAPAQVIHVAPGNDAASGSSGQPLATLAEASRQARQRAAGRPGPIRIVIADGV